MLHYEIHVTVKTKDVEQFKAKCKAIGVKPIVIDLQKKSGDVLCDVMTSSTISTSDRTIETARKEMLYIEMELVKSGFNVVRCKIETVPWHPEAPSEHNGKRHFPGSHFESHLGVIVKNSLDFYLLQEFSKKFSMHLSKNAFKKFDDGSFCQMVTFRSYTAVKEDFELTINEIVRTLKDHGLVFEKAPTIEFAIYDSDAAHDNDWLED